MDTSCNWMWLPLYTIHSSRMVAANWNIQLPKSLMNSAERLVVRHQRPAVGWATWSWHGTLILLTLKMRSRTTSSNAKWQYVFVRLYCTCESVHGQVCLCGKYYCSSHYCLLWLVERLQMEQRAFLCLQDVVVVECRDIQATRETFTISVFNFCVEPQRLSPGWAKQRSNDFPKVVQCMSSSGGNRLRREEEGLNYGREKMCVTRLTNTW